ncbi:hypothetical protein SAMN05421678_105188 [Actinopolymorpha cephalotaxi]|uniref:Uncharacterized protein n=1 Tax=Actinopolymorpha cephalotaxi TaxID=504797 RepID=A0A1I2R5R7_9ACTN|nr:hypothetical protein SAMN05421678_105188 [Actinopolymorpha cephalotaxi]
MGAFPHSGRRARNVWGETLAQPGRAAARRPPAATSANFQRPDGHGACRTGGVQGAVGGTGETDDTDGADDTDTDAENPAGSDGTGGTDAPVLSRAIRR